MHVYLETGNLVAQLLAVLLSLMYQAVRVGAGVDSGFSCLNVVLTDVRLL